MRYFFYDVENDCETQFIGMVSDHEAVFLNTADHHSSPITIFYRWSDSNNSVVDGIIVSLQLYFTILNKTSVHNQNKFPICLLFRMQSKENIEAKSKMILTKQYLR